MKYFIRAIANAKNKSQRDALCLSSWSCGMPVPAFHSCRFGKDGCLSTRHACFWFPPPSSCSSISMEIKKKDKGRKECLIFLRWKIEKRKQKRRFDLWEIRFPSEMYLIHFPRPISSTKQVKKCFFGCFFTAKWCTKKKKNFCRRRIQTFGRCAPPSECTIFLLSIHSQHPFSPGWHLLLARGWINHT